MVVVAIRISKYLYPDFIVGGTAQKSFGGGSTIICHWWSLTLLRKYQCLLLVVYVWKGAIYRYERMGNWCANKKVLTFGTQAVRLPPPWNHLVYGGDLQKSLLQIRSIFNFHGFALRGGAAYIITTKLGRLSCQQVFLERRSSGNIPDSLRSICQSLHFKTQTCKTWSLINNFHFISKVCLARNTMASILNFWIKSSATTLKVGISWSPPPCFAIL